MIWKLLKKEKEKQLWGVPPLKQDLFRKKLCVYSYMFKLQSPSKYSPFVFSTAQNSFWTHRFWCLLVLLLFFVLPLPHLQNVSLWGLFFIQGNKKCHLGQDRVNREGEAGMRVMLFLVKNCWTLSALWAGVLVNHPSWNGQRHSKDLQKNFHWSGTQPHTPPAASTLIQMGS